MRDDGPLTVTAAMTLSIMPNAPAVRQALRDAFDQPPLNTLDHDLRGTVELVLAELLNNIVEHGDCRPGDPIRLHIRQSEQGVRCTLCDGGIPLPDARPPLGRFPATDASGYPAEGGYGWYLVRALAKNLSYTRHPGKNLLSFELRAKQHMVSRGTGHQT